jgi:hypothetical protein
MLKPLKAAPPVRVVGHNGAQKEVALMVSGADDNGQVILSATRLFALRSN